MDSEAEAAQARLTTPGLMAALATRWWDGVEGRCKCGSSRTAQLWEAMRLRCVGLCHLVDFVAAFSVIFSCFYQLAKVF